MDVIYGLHPVEEALKARRRRFDHVLDARERQDDRLQRLVAQCRQSGIRIRAESREQLILEHLPQVNWIATRIHEKLPGNTSLEDLISIGAYQNGANALVDAALRMQEPIQRFLQQDRTEHSTLFDATQMLTELKQLRDAGPFSKGVM